jgi:ORF6N domain
MARPRAALPVQNIDRAILKLRGQRVILDVELAALYGVTTKRLNEQVRRNRDRFPVDFVFQLTSEEVNSLRSQIATLKIGRGQHRKYLPYVFTEHGAIMAATILNSSHAVEMSIHIVRAFVQLRELFASGTILAQKLNELEQKLNNHDEAIADILSAIRELTNPFPPKRRAIGFTADLEAKR